MKSFLILWNLCCCVVDLFQSERSRTGVNQYGFVIQHSLSPKSESHYRHLAIDNTIKFYFLSPSLAKASGECDPLFVPGDAFDMVVRWNHICHLAFPVPSPVGVIFSFLDMIFRKTSISFNPFCRTLQTTS